MKRILLAGAVVVMTASVAFAVSGMGKNEHTIQNSKHNIPTGNFKGAPTGYQQICIYCHTPHNPRLNVPLWNRNAQTGNALNFTFYNSPSLSTYSKKLTNVVVNPQTVSGMCLSCHDGKTALGNIRNAADTGITAASVGTISLNTTDASIVDGGTINAAGDRTNGGNSSGVRGIIGTDLSNDHPVGINYDNAYNSVDVDQGTGTEQGNNIVYRLVQKDTVAKTLGNFLFSSAGLTGEAATQLECASCHKVHDPFNPPFLRVTNNMSHLCLACHNK
jgi:predicted CXXCH cytochrome family protein